MTGEWREQYNEVPRDLYFSLSIRMIRSRRIGLEGHVAQMREKRTAYRLLMGKNDVGGWITLRWILEREDEVVWSGLVWVRIGAGGYLL
jgi:hypothetical protein